MQLAVPVLLAQHQPIHPLSYHSLYFVMPDLLVQQVVSFQIKLNNYQDYLEIDMVNFDYRH
jgi:hypothetical protein